MKNLTKNIGYLFIITGCGGGDLTQIGTKLQCEGCGTGGVSIEGDSGGIVAASGGKIGTGGSTGGGTGGAAVISSGGMAGGSVGGLVGTGGSNTGAGGTQAGSGGSGPCIPKTCITVSVEKGWSLPGSSAGLCGVVSDNCGNYIDCGGCSNPSEKCGGAAPLVTTATVGITKRFVDVLGIPNKCGGGCVDGGAFGVPVCNRQACSAMNTNPSCKQSGLAPNDLNGGLFSGTFWCC